VAPERRTPQAPTPDRSHVDENRAGDVPAPCRGRERIRALSQQLPVTARDTALRGLRVLPTRLASVEIEAVERHVPVRREQLEPPLLLARKLRTVLIELRDNFLFGG
jgi:hypothetical protein